MLAVARGLARKGAIVITDRWPQNLRAGLLDGPSRIPLNGSAIVRFLGSIERSLYRRMEIYEPDLTIHLLSDFETSNERKPGASEPARFEQRRAQHGAGTNLPASFAIDARIELRVVAT